MPPPEPAPIAPAGPGRYRRALGALGTGLGFTLIFTSALVVSVIAHLDLAPTRRTARVVANQMLGTLFEGSIEVGEIDQLRLCGIAIRSATAFDPRRNQVAHIDGLRADTEVPCVDDLDPRQFVRAFGVVVGIVRDAMRGRTRVIVPLIHIDNADVTLDRGKSGLGIAEAFLLRKPGEPPKPGAVPSRVSLSRIEIDHAGAHGAIAPPANVDAHIHYVVASVDVAPDGVTVQVSPVLLEVNAPVPQPLFGDVTFDLRVPPSRADAADKPPHIHAGFEGKLGDLDLYFDASLEGQHVSALFQVPCATPEVIASFVPGRPKLPLQSPVSLNVTADGDLPEIDLAASLDLDTGGSIDVTGGVSISAPPMIDLRYGVSRLDLRLLPGVPAATPFDAFGRATMVFGSEDTVIAVEAATRPFSIAKTPIPAVKAEAWLERGVWRAIAEVDEPGAPTTATFWRDKSGVVHFDVKTRAKSLRAIPRLGGAPIDGSATVKIEGTIEKGAISASIEGHAQKLRAPGDVALDEAKIDAKIEGPLDRPVLRDAKVRGSKLRAARYSWETVDVDASGPLRDGALKVTTLLDAGGGESITAEAAIEPKNKALRDVALTLKRTTGVVKTTVDAISMGPGGVRFEKLAMHGDGIGDLHGDLTLQGKELVGKLYGRDVNLARIGGLAGVALPVTGLANIDIDLASSRPGERRGHIAIEVANVKSGQLKKQVSGVESLSSSGSFVATFEGDRVRLDGLMRLVDHASPKDKPGDRCDGAIAAVRVSDGRAVIGGPLLDPATWKRVSGEITIAADDWNLRCLERHSPLPLVLNVRGKLTPIEVRGKVTTRATIALSPGARLPTVKAFIARTRGLEIEGPEDFPGNSRSVDVEIKGAFDPASGKVEASVALDDTRPIASVAARATIDAEGLLAASNADRWKMLRRAPLSVQIAVPRRAIGAFASLPQIVRDHLPPLAGDVGIEGSIEGSIDAPLANIDVNGWGIAHVGRKPPAVSKKGKAPPPLEDTPWALPVDLVDKFTYDGQKATARARVMHDDHEIAMAEAELIIPVADLLDQKPVLPKGRLNLTLTRAPLGDLPFFSDRGIAGNLSGKVVIAGLGEAPTVKADLGIPDLKVGHDLAYDDASIKLDVGRVRGHEAKKDRGAAKAAVILSSKTGGKLTVDASSEILWKNALVPASDPSRRSDLFVKADKFRIAVLGPFVAGVLSSIDGTLDGHAGVALIGLDDDKAKIDVDMKLTGGVLHAPQLGQELHDVEVAIKGGGGGIVRLDKLNAEATKGRITGSGRAKFKGVQFEHAEAKLEIKEGEELPITLEGVQIGDARGMITVRADKHDHDLAIKVGIPSFFLALPVSTGRGVQGLDANPNIVITQDRPREEEEERPKSPSRMALTFDIGDIGIKGSLGVVNIKLDVGMSGVKGAPLKVVVADKTQVSGDIQLTRGSIELLKRTFQIERGTVHMRPEDPGNPYLDVTARWDSPEGEIYVEYVGVLLPIAKEKIKLRSPKLSESQILATLLSGGAKQTTGVATEVGAGTGQSIAQQLIAQQFSTQIAENISTSLGTSDDGAVRPGLVYTSGNKIIEVSTYGASGQASAGGGAALKGQRTQISVDWRFWRNWSLRGRVDAGSDQTLTGVDLLWQYRY